MTKSNAISNTSPLIFLAQIDALPLLETCFNHIIIPEAVAEEWKIEAIPSFIQVDIVSSLGKQFVEAKIGSLHRGELEAIQLAKERKHEIVLMDDLSARKYAQRQDLLPIGVLGILRMAHLLNQISLPDLKIKVNILIEQHDLFVSKKILNHYWESLAPPH